MPADLVPPVPGTGTWPERWIHGHRPGQPDRDPPIQVHWYDEHTVILRQSLATDYEGPFLVLLFGSERALLWDTGATADPARFPLRPTVDGLVGGWLEAHPRSDYGLVIAHSHAHGDHVAGDGQFTDRASTTVVGHGVDDVRTFFGLDDWPSQVATFDLGQRVLEVTGIPGHHAASIAIHDPWTGILLTGDTVYPGRLYVQDMPAFVDSLERLVALAEARGVREVVGCHIELRATPGHDHPLGFAYHPDEPPLAMSLDQLRAVRDGVRAVARRPGVHVLDDAIIWHGHPTRALLAQLGRAWAARIRYRLRA
ncbi:MAG TPA: MBL fold metallo-hydrolase [Candidatus Saccharimonadales bacterium]|nr:MBL fold metallo-hydrolase [Candidatus Saccharimonadales bacterium]